METSVVSSLLSIAVASATSVLFATLGGMLMEKAGVICLLTEGGLLISAMSGFAAAYYSQSVLVGIAVAMIAGASLALVHAFWSVTLHANQVVSGLGSTLLGTGVALFFGQPLAGILGPSLHPTPIPLLSSLPIVGMAFFHQDALVYVLYGCVLGVWWYMYYTRPGIHLRAIGEHPQAAFALGVSVNKLRYLYVVVGGMLIGLGGAHLSLVYTPGWSDAISGGKGWIAVAMVIFSSWHPLRAVVGALLFGGLTALQFQLQTAGVAIPGFVLKMMPYVATILAVTLITQQRIVKKHSPAPAALGMPFLR